jgi:hypothetical protein
MLLSHTIRGIKDKIFGFKAIRNFWTHESIQTMLVKRWMDDWGRNWLDLIMDQGFVQHWPFLEIEQDVF